MIRPRVFGTALAIGQKIYAIGGNELKNGLFGDYATSIEVYDEGKWSLLRDFKVSFSSLF